MSLLHTEIQNAIVSSDKEAQYDGFHAQTSDRRSRSGPENR